MSQIGEPQRFIIVTPVYEPVPQADPVPAQPVREPEPVAIPEEVPSGIVR